MDEIIELPKPVPSKITAVPLGGAILWVLDTGIFHLHKAIFCCVLEKCQFLRQMVSCTISRKSIRKSRRTKQPPVGSSRCVPPPQERAIGPFPGAFRGRRR